VAAELFERILSADPPTFALLYRPESAGPAELDVLVGDLSLPDSLADIPLPGQGSGETIQRSRHDVLAIVPYRQIAERGFACPDDGAPLLAITVTGQGVLPLAEAVDRLPEVPIALADGHFDVDDDTYAEIVRKILTEEIGTGEGANFVIKRSFVAEVIGYTPASALTFFRRLLEQESGSYWTFIVHTGQRTFVGASPERHISVRDGVAVMNPVSGTYRYPPSGPNLPGVMRFLADRKETDELYMVVDEELKMMARICDSGGRVVGPYLKEMARLAHTEYLIEGYTTRDSRTILRESMFAPTVTGSPLESACRVITRYEPGGRGYYAGGIALFGRDTGGQTLDSAILIRTADIDAAGKLGIGVGATLVRHSDPDSEVAETRAKVAGLLAAFDGGGQPRFGDHPNVRAALDDRNDTLSGFWLAENPERARPRPELSGRSVLVIDAEDDFTLMLDHQLRSLGLSVTVSRFDEPHTYRDYDFVVMGPGPGDPRDAGQHKIAHLRSAIDELIADRRPFLAVCLSHQVLSLRLGLDLVRRDVPNQGVQREIDLFGARERVGFYNTFAANSQADRIDSECVGSVEVCRDVESGEVHALRGPFFSSMQFHAESVLTSAGVRIIGTMISDVFDRMGTTQPASDSRTFGRPVRAPDTFWSPTLVATERAS
jgi:phenazine biosynthesis protein phzE